MYKALKCSNYTRQIVRRCGLLVTAFIVPYHMQKMNHLIQKWLFRDQHMHLSLDLHLKDRKDLLQSSWMNYIANPWGFDR